MLLCWCVGATLGTPRIWFDAAKSIIRAAWIRMVWLFLGLFSFLITLCNWSRPCVFCNPRWISNVEYLFSTLSPLHMFSSEYLVELIWNFPTSKKFSKVRLTLLLSFASYFMISCQNQVDINHKRLLTNWWQFVDTNPFDVLILILLMSCKIGA